MSSFLPPVARGPGSVVESAAWVAGRAGDCFSGAGDDDASGKSRLATSAGSGALTWLGTACHRLASALAWLISAGVILVSRTPINWRLPFRYSSTLVPAETM